MPAVWTQSYPPAPHFTDENLPSQEGKVFLITGGAGGLGLHIAAILYRAHGTIYIAGRSKAKADKSIGLLQSCFPSSKGSLKFIFVDLGDLRTIKPAVKEFQEQETKIDVLYNNAGVGGELGKTTSPQGIELHFATNCVGPLLFTRLLQRELEFSKGPARVVWTSSLTVESYAPPGGVDLSKLEETTGDTWILYATTKAGNWLIASELAKENPKVIHLAMNPGNLKTNIWKSVSWLYTQLLNLTMLYPAKNGAFTAIWAGCSKDITSRDSGRFVIPWGRWHPEPREDILASLKTKEEGGTGVAQDFVKWCEDKYQEFK